MSKRNGKIKVNKGFSLKYGRKINHICDKIYGHKSTSVSGVYPITKKPVWKSIYYKSVKKELKDLFYKLLIWLCILAASGMLSYALSYVSFVISVCFLLPFILTFIISWICYIISFRGKVLKFLDLYAANAPEAFRKEVDKINLSNNTQINLKNYRQLDTLSQIADTEQVRAKKIQILNALSEEYGHDWTYETDTVLLNNGRMAKDYLKNVRNIDTSKLGYISKKYLLDAKFPQK